MEALPPILAYIHASEEAEKRAQDAAQPSQPVPVIDPKLSPQGGPSEPLPAGNGQAAGELDGTAADRGPITAEEISSIESRLKRLHFQKEKTPKKVSNRSVVRAVQAMHEPSEGVRRPPICYCGTPRSSEVDVHLREDEAGRKTAGVTGVWRCRNLETCPMCVKVGTARRRDSYARVGGAAVEKGGRIVTVVLSVSHGLQDSLADLMQGVKTASTTARAGNPWLKDKASLGCVGVLVDHHVRFGEQHGWHYHQHLTLFCLSQDEVAIKAAIASLIARYVRLLARQGYRADVERQHVKILKEEAGAGPYTYPSDHNRAGEDRSLDYDDHGEEHSLCPMMLAERAAAGDEQAAARFMEFSRAIKGTRSVVVTPAMARALEIERQVEEPQAYDEKTRLGSIPGTVWTKLLDENLATTFLTRVESAGREHWPAVRWWALEKAGEAPDFSGELAKKVAELIQAQQLLEDQTAQGLAQGQIESMRAAWTERHGADLVAATMEYLSAHYRYMQVDAASVQQWMDILEDHAGKIRRRRASEARLNLPDICSPDPPIATSTGQSV